MEVSTAARPTREWKAATCTRAANALMSGEWEVGCDTISTQHYRACVGRASHHHLGTCSTQAAAGWNAAWRGSFLCQEEKKAAQGLNLQAPSASPRMGTGKQRHRGCYIRFFPPLASLTICGRLVMAILEAMLAPTVPPMPREAAGRAQRVMQLRRQC
jgi:hypothetical protein